jgi:hypothetical protein
LIIVGGEEELLAFYLLNNKSFERFSEADNIMIQDGSWDHLQNKSEYKAKKKADKISYGWDSIIDRANEGSKKYELVARELARPNRFQRRYLSKVFFKDHVLAHKDDKHDLFRSMLVGDGTTYCFLFQDDPQPHERRKKILEVICWIARYKFQQNKKVLGIATEKQFRPECSYDFCFMNLPELTKKNKEEIVNMQRKLDIFVNPDVVYTYEDEYPKR